MPNCRDCSCKPLINIYTSIFYQNINLFPFIFQIILIIELLVILYTAVTATGRMNRYRSLHTLKNETEAILPGRILNYNNGQLDLIPNRFKYITTQPFQLDCSSPAVYNHISQSSSCPWMFQLNIDVNRIPREIFEAKCRTRTCLNTNMEGCIEHRCEEIKYFTWVKRRNGVHSFVKVLEPISVGCTCACNRMSDTFTSYNRPIMCS